MKKFYVLALVIFIAQISRAQIVINELDSDTEGIDDKEFVELKTEQPFMALDDYVLVFFNGSSAGGNKSYFTVDLSGETSDINGVFLIGSTNVSPFPDHLIPINTIQNGADAVGIYEGSAADFPDWTPATTDNLIDALVYGTSDPVSQDLIELLGQTEQIDEDIHNNKDFESIQRADDGSYFVDIPTPGQPNEESGIILNGIKIDIPQDSYEEGDTVPLTFTADEPVDDDLSFDFELTNGPFDDSDYTGNTQVQIQAGDSTVTDSIFIVDDGVNDGDKIMKFTFGTLPDDIRRLNDEIEVRIIDVNYREADFGTPLSPTYNIVESTQPLGYYDSLDGLSGDELKQAVQVIIADPDKVHTQTYADVINILKEADQNPANSNEVWLLYTEQGRAKLDYQNTSNSVGKWNREHTYPRSRGGFYLREGDEIPDGKNVYWVTNADSTRQGLSDAHALRAVDGPENSSRNNQNYGPEAYKGPEGTEGSFYGDVARSVLYMAVRYNELEVVEGYPPSHPTGKLGDLQTLLDWNQTDPPDDFEMNRNNIIYTWQHNRNPFIDYPELIDYIWGEHAGEVWHQPDMGVRFDDSPTLEVYPNPTYKNLHIRGLNPGSSKLQIVGLNGRILKTTTTKEQQTSLELNALSPGVYILKAYNNKKTKIVRFVIE